MLPEDCRSSDGAVIEGTFADYERIQHFIRSIRHHSTGRRGSALTLFAVTLTYPPWARPTWFYPSAVMMADLIASRRDEGLWLMADVSRLQRFHWHGLAVTTRDQKWLQRKWAELTGATVKAQSIRFIKGQRNRHPTNMSFRTHLARAIRYRFKAPKRWSVSRVDRAVATGVLLDIWKSATGVGTASRDFVPRLPSWLDRASENGD